MRISPTEIALVLAVLGGGVAVKVAADGRQFGHTIISEKDRELVLDRIKANSPTFKVGR